MNATTPALRYQITWDKSPDRRVIVIDTHEGNRVVLDYASLVACHLRARRLNREWESLQKS